MGDLNGWKFYCLTFAKAIFNSCRSIAIFCAFRKLLERVVSELGYTCDVCVFLQYNMTWLKIRNVILTYRMLSQIYSQQWHSGKWKADRGWMKSQYHLRTVMAAWFFSKNKHGNQIKHQNTICTTQLND